MLHAVYSTGTGVLQMQMLQIRTASSCHHFKSKAWTYRGAVEDDVQSQLIPAENSGKSALEPPRG